MSYFGFLLIFLVSPIAVLLVVLSFRRRSGRGITLGGRAAWIAVAAQMLLAFVYTTPWDNYLVATGVWYYNPARVTGIVLGYVPLEEYLFFLLEALLVGLWWITLLPSGRPSSPFKPSFPLRQMLTAGAFLIWIISTATILRGWIPGTYLTLILSWALVPIGIQLSFGADLLWHSRRLVAATILPAALYLSLADALAIKIGIWTIDPAKTTALYLCCLPLEEGLFFLVTATVLGFGMTLALIPEGQERLELLARRLGLWRFLDRAATSRKRTAAESVRDRTDEEI
jgi:lycopene cyclase domain-containing protein